MNRAKELCLGLERSPRYAQISTGKATPRRIIGVTRVVLAHQDETFTRVVAANKANYFMFENGQTAWERAVADQMRYYLSALSRHAKKHIRRWYDAVRGDPQIFEYGKRLLFADPHKRRSG